MPASPPSRPRRRAPARPAPPSAPVSWEDRLLAGADRVLGATLRPPSKAAKARQRTRSSRLFTGSWRRASIAEAIGAGVLLLMVVIARPSAGAAADVAAEADTHFDAVATGVAPDGAIVLTSGARIHLLGVTLPTPEDPRAVRGAAFDMLDRLVRGRRVQVQFDPVLPGHLQEGQPMTVAYLWVLDSEGRRRTMANTVLLARGLARPVTTLGYAEQATFVQATYLAQDRGAGLWHAPPADAPMGAPMGAPVGAPMSAPPPALLPAAW